MNVVAEIHKFGVHKPPGPTRLLLSPFTRSPYPPPFSLTHTYLLHAMDWGLGSLEKKFNEFVQDRAKDQLPPQFHNQIPQNLGQQVVGEGIKDIIETGKAVDDFVNSTLPGAAPKSKSPYKHVPGMTP